MFDESAIDIVAGPSQRSYAIATSFVFWFGALLAVFNALALSIEPWRNVLTPVRNWTTGALFLDVAVLVVLMILHRIQGSREAGAGYTTLSRGRIELPEVDPASGAILREAGAPYLSREEFKSALQHARSEKG